MKGDTMSTVRRVIADKRRLVLPLALVLLLNAAAYAFVVYPLRLRVASGERRAVAAEGAMRAAERERAAARATIAGKERAEAELRKFYSDVLPRTFPDARRVLYLRISQIARESALQYKRRTFEEEKEADRQRGDVQKLTASVVLEGSYENVRKFIYQLETASDFVVIENVSLGARNEGNAPLVLTVVVSTYYRTAGNVA